MTEDDATFVGTNRTPECFFSSSEVFLHVPTQSHPQIACASPSPLHRVHFWIQFLFTSFLLLRTCEQFLLLCFCFLFSVSCLLGSAFAETSSVDKVFIFQALILLRIPVMSELHLTYTGSIKQCCSLMYE